MNKNLRYYLICWVILVAIFNAICFLISDIADSFWFGYGLIMMTLVVHLLYACFTFGTKSGERLILDTPLIIVSFIELILMIIAGAVCMSLPELSSWVGVILCIAILVFSVIYITIKAVADNAWKGNKVLNERTAVVRELADQAQLLQKKAVTEEEKRITRQIYEAIRYSDTISGEETWLEDVQIEAKLAEISSILQEHSEGIIGEKAEEILELVEARNLKCKRLKRGTL